MASGFVTRWLPRHRIAARLTVVGGMAVGGSPLVAQSTDKGDVVPIVVGADVPRHVGRAAVVCGTAASIRTDTTAQDRPTFVNLDHPYPRQSLAVMIPGDVRDRLPATALPTVGRLLCVSGIVEELPMTPPLFRIVVRLETQLLVLPRPEDQAQ